MPTLVIHAPYRRGKPGTPTSFETYLKTGVGKGYAISQKGVSKLPSGSKVVLLRKDKHQKRAEGLLVKLAYTGRTIPQGMRCYDVYFKDQRQVPYKPEKLNRFGVAVLDCGDMKFAVTFERDEDGFIVVSCPALPGCHSQGKTREEAITNIKEAIRGYIASMRKHGEPIPAITEVEEVEVAV